MEHRGLGITLIDSKEFDSIPPKKWGMLDLPSGNLLSLQLAFEKKGTPMIRKGYWKDDGKAKLVKVGKDYKHVVEKYVLSPRKETPTPGIWASRLENLKQPYSPEDLKAIREGELVNYLVDKYGEFEYKDGDDYYRYGCDKTVIIVNDKEIEVSLPDTIGDDREVFAEVIRTYTIDPEKWIEENAALIYDIIADLYSNGEGANTFLVEDDVDLSRVCSLLRERTENIKFTPTENEVGCGILISVNY